MTSKVTRELKNQIKEARDKILDTIKSELDKPEDKQVKVVEAKDQLKALQEKLELIKMNPNGSSFFEWHPHKGFNRQQAKRFRKSTRKR